MRSIQAKLISAILLILFGSLVILGGLNYWKARSLLIDEISEKLLVQTKTAGTELSEWLITQQHELRLVALSPVLYTKDKAAIAGYLKSVLEYNKVYDDMVFVDVNGDFVSDRGATGNMRDREHFKATMRGETYIADPSISRTTGVKIVPVAIPITVNGKIVGELVGGIKLDALDEKVMTLKSGKTGFGFLLQKDGLIIAHPKKDFVMKYNPVTAQETKKGHRAVTEQLIKGETGVKVFNVGGQDEYYAYTTIKGTGWIITQFVPAVEVQGAVGALTYVTGITIVVIMLLAAVLVAWFARMITGPVRELDVAVERMANGDLAAYEHDFGNDEIGRLGRSVEKMANNLRNLVHKITDASAHVAASSEQLTASAEQSALGINKVSQVIGEVAAGAQEQLGMVEHTTMVVERMSRGIQQVADDAAMVTMASDKSAQAAQGGSQAVAKAIEQMKNIDKTVTKSAEVVGKLGERSNEIGQIVDTIVNIAGQTNLLALNAAIEAARAGEQGRGFAVVADEVRKLAEESQLAAKQIALMVGEIREETDMAVAAMKTGTSEVKLGAEVVGEAGDKFREIDQMISQVSEQIKGISIAIKQAASGSDEIVSSVRSIDTISRTTAEKTGMVSENTEEQSATMQEIAASSEELAKMAEELVQTVGQFRL